MTLEELNRYRKLQREIRALEAQIATLENTPLPSGGEKIGSKPSGVSDPTRDQAMRLIRQRERLETLRLKADVECDAIEMWLETVEDPEVRAIVRLRFMVGRSWQKTTLELFGRYAAENTANMKLLRYLTKL